MITELIADVVKRIEATEGRSRSRDDNAQASFEYAVALLLIDLWKSVWTCRVFVPLQVLV